ncbi:hypothetical protein CLOM_g17253 [Closterium sp. NIES-68]|nr:hypothetical protein CLOM_g17251 [Closterium sp. NIES-68]GJP32644.1 hypothetical protein CLOM_g17253 [Closterium sp. NIES-68]GJP63750.1 hypothetical protein CLOP_g20798 [Closterium sp. NIES-67]GJP63751.1 hypothetical protein CLOP_g20799 [Closterium sp. NIES-67]
MAKLGSSVAWTLLLLWAVVSTTIAATAISLLLVQSPAGFYVQPEAEELPKEYPRSHLKAPASAGKCTNWIAKPPSGWGVQNPWTSVKYFSRISPCPVAGLPIEELDMHLNFRRAYSLGFEHDVEDKTQVLPTMRAVLDPSMNARKRRVLIDLGAKSFGTSVAWFLHMYPLDFTEVHAVEVKPTVFQPPAGLKELNSMAMDRKSHVLQARSDFSAFPAWLIKRVHAYNFFVSTADNPEQNTVNATRWLLEELKLTAGDSVVVKMDIETSEWGIFEEWLTMPEMPKIVDELFVEIHYSHPSMAGFNWSNFPKTREQAGDIFNRLRAAGFYAHAWP